MSSSKNPFKQRARQAACDPPPTPSPNKTMRLQVQLQCSSFAQRDTPLGVFMPKLQPYPTPEDKTDTGFPHLDSENDHIEWRDITCTWKGLSIAQAEELAIWEECLRHVLESYAAGVIEKSFQSCYSHAAAAPLFERVQLMLDFVRDIGTASFQIDPIRLLDQLVNAYRIHTSSVEEETWLSAPQESHQNLSRFLTTLDCFAPSAANVAIYTARLSARLIDDRLVCIQGQMDWYPPRPFFLNLQPTAAEHSEYFITPRYKEYQFCSIMDDDTVSCQHVATSDFMPMSWDPHLETFRTRIGCKPMTPSSNFTRVTTVATKHFAGGVRFERVMRCRLALEITSPRRQATLNVPLLSNDGHQQLKSPRSTPALIQPSPAAQRPEPTSQSLRIPRRHDVLRDVSQNSHRVQGTAGPLHGYDDNRDEYPARPDTPVLQPLPDAFDDFTDSQVPSQFELEAGSLHPKVAATYDLARQARRAQRAKLSMNTSPEMEWVLRPKATQVRMMTGTTIKHNPEKESLPDYDDGHILPYSGENLARSRLFVVPRSSGSRHSSMIWPEPPTMQLAHLNANTGSGHICRDWISPRSIWQLNNPATSQVSEQQHRHHAAEARMATESRHRQTPHHQPSLDSQASVPASMLRTPSSIKHSINYILNSDSNSTPLKRTISASAKKSPTKQLRRNKASQDLRQAATLGKSYFKNSPHVIRDPLDATVPPWASPAWCAPSTYPIPCDEQSRGSSTQSPTPKASTALDTLDTDMAWRIERDLCPRICRTPIAAIPHNFSDIADSDMMGLLSFFDDSSPTSASSWDSLLREPEHHAIHAANIDYQSTGRTPKRDPRMSIGRLLCPDERYNTRTVLPSSSDVVDSFVQPSLRSTSLNVSDEVLELLRIPRSRPQAPSPPDRSIAATKANSNQRKDHRVLGARSVSQLNCGLDQILKQKGRNPSDKDWFTATPTRAFDMNQTSLEDPFLFGSVEAQQEIADDAVKTPSKCDVGMSTHAVLAFGSETRRLPGIWTEISRHDAQIQTPRLYTRRAYVSSDETIGSAEPKSKIQGGLAGPEKSRAESSLQSYSSAEDMDSERDRKYIGKGRNEQRKTKSNTKTTLRDSLIDEIANAGQPSHVGLINRSEVCTNRAADEPTTSKLPTGMAKSPRIDLVAAVPDDLEDFQMQINRRLASCSAEAQAGSSPLKGLSNLTPSVSPTATPRGERMSADDIQAEIQRNFREFEARGLEVSSTRQISMGSAMSLEDDSRGRMEGLFLEMESFTDDRSDQGTNA